MVDKPLMNRRILVTRDAEQSRGMIRKINRLGGEAVSFPTIRISEPDDWTACDSAIRQLNSYDWIIFTSTNGVDYFFQRMKKMNTSTVRSSIAVVGAKTADRVVKYGYNVDLIPPEYNAKSLVKVFGQKELVGKMVLWPTSSLSKKGLSEGLANYGAIVSRVVVYQTKKMTGEGALSIKSTLLDQKIDCITFFSPSSFHSFLTIFDEEDWIRKDNNLPAIAAIGGATARAIEGKGFTVNIIPEESVEDSMVQAIVEFYKNK